MEKTLAEKAAIVAELRPIDDVFFEVLADDKAVCQEMLRTILDDDRLIVIDVIVQSSERNLYGRSIRLDALCRLGTGLWVNIEVQRSDDDDHVRRVRFNAASITVRESQKNEKFSKIPDVTVVYISEFDIFKCKKPLYHVTKVLQESGDRVDDGLKEVFANTAVNDGSKVSRLMNHFLQTQVDDPEFPAMSARVHYLKNEEKGVAAVCKVVEEYARQENARIQAELDKTREELNLSNAERDRANARADQANARADQANARAIQANARADRSDLEIAALRKELADLKASVNQGTAR